MSRLPLVVCVVGPTACHKTALSVQLAKRLDGEILSADSVAVYRGLDVGSAKPTLAERQGVPHHLLDCADVTDTSFSVAQFKTLANAALDDVLSRRRLPIVVGGSGMYCDAIFADMTFCAPSDAAIRTAIESDYEADKNAVFLSLQKVDAETASRLHPNDAKRVVRALEVYRITGQPISALNRRFQAVQEETQRVHVLRIGLTMNRQTLYARIDERVDAMVQNGLVAEAYGLFDQGLTPELPALQSIGYAQLYDAYVGRVTLDAAKQAIKLATRHFAKRQLTWFRRNPNTQWFSVDAYPDLNALEDAVLDVIQKELS